MNPSCLICLNFQKIAQDAKLRCPHCVDRLVISSFGAGFAMAKSDPARYKTVMDAWNAFQDAQAKVAIDRAAAQAKTLVPPRGKHPKSPGEGTGPKFEKL